ncbi:exodeoxyribonuclease VII large subunit [Geobacter argillaceus]|uniref:Exodeoxyribonuclease 7 large subunit n=1 Tax=Geobacter argillaceus TaxID=345631 RepID=A0A562VP42_9BACT|nr:exodeoxyribonuclease VII large subunit [Geobacter argillaceus]TWJ19648.1 exodeoxyribonuclease VII large subunit [Geobacter argillaceus]
MDLFSEKRILTVSQLTALVRGVLEENFQQVWVEGEISNLAQPSSGHCYFTLKDGTAQIRCVMFRGAARMLRFRPQDGMGLIARGRLSVYDQRGDYQLLVEYLEPKGVGALQLAFQQLKERLAREGLFDERHKKPLPLLPQRIGIVTSPTGAAIHDILHVLNRRFANLEILLYPVKVQGEGAGGEIAAAIREFNRHGQVDVLIVGRGGGSLEDLWAFNEEVVARSIHASKIPVISAVGHEVDVTIADLVADLRAPTPSAAAELVVGSKVELEERLILLEHRLQQAMRHCFADLRGRLTASTRALRDPTTLLGHAAQRVDDLAERLAQATRWGVAARKERLERRIGQLRMASPLLKVERGRELLISCQARNAAALCRQLDRNRERLAIAGSALHALSPLLTLGRGYAVVQKYPELAVVKDAGQLAAGDRLNVILQKGEVDCLVEKVKE